MKMSLIAVTASIALTGIAPGLIAPAAAQHRTVHRGPVHHARPVCHWESHHHHRVRVCR